MSPGGNIHRRVRSGETFHVPARAYNEMLDAADEARAVKALPGHIAATTSPANAILLAYNASDYNAPRGAMVELRARGDTVAQIEFVRPGDDGGLDIYGVAVDPIPEGKMGRVAFSGGPWRVLAPVAVVGDTLGAVEGAWTAGVVGNGPLTVVRESIGGVAAAFFSRAGTLYHEVAAHKRLTTGTPGGQWLYWDHRGNQAFEVYKLAAPCSLIKGIEVGIISSSWVFEFYDQWNGPLLLRAEAITEDFDLDALTFTQYLALSRQQETLWGVSHDNDGSTTSTDTLQGQLLAEIQGEGTAHGIAVRADSPVTTYPATMSMLCAGPRVRVMATEGDNW
jgi:hypothetical protein